MTSETSGNMMMHKDMKNHNGDMATGMHSDKMPMATDKAMSGNMMMHKDMKNHNGDMATDMHSDKMPIATDKAMSGSMMMHEDAKHMTDEAKKAAEDDMPNGMKMPKKDMPMKPAKGGSG